MGWILGLLGVGGVAGLGAMAFFAPTMFASVLAAFKTGAEFVLDMLSGWPLKAYLICVLLVIAATYFSGQRGWDRGVAWQKGRDQAAAFKAYLAGKHFAGRVRAGEIRIVTNMTVEEGRIDVRFNAIKKEIVRYVTPQIDRKYPLPCGLVRVRDAAVLGVDPASVASAACKADDAAAPTTASAFSAGEVEWGRAYWRLHAYAKAVLADDELVRAEYQRYRGTLLTERGKR